MEVIKTSLFSFVLDVFINKRFVKDINITLISLIPKIPKPDLVS